MAEYYKFEIANWNEGTADLTLEQEAAYLRVVNAIRLADQPIAFNKFALCGLWRCNERKAKRLLDELVAAKKLRIEDGKIINDKAVDDASNLRRLRADRASAGSRGGIESGKSRSKSLESKETREAIASTREEKRREEKSVVACAGAKPENQPSDQTARERLLAAIGADPISGMMGPNGATLGRQSDMQTAAGWADLGLTIDQQCRIIGERMASARAKVPHFVPRSFAYFTGAMQDAVSARSTAGAVPRKSQSTGPFGDPTLDLIARQVGQA